MCCSIQGLFSLQKHRNNFVKTSRLLDHSVESCENEKASVYLSFLCGCLRKKRVTDALKGHVTQTSDAEDKPLLGTLPQLGVGKPGPLDQAWSAVSFCKWCFIGTRWGLLVCMSFMVLGCSDHQAEWLQQRLRTTQMSERVPIWPFLEEVWYSSTLTDRRSVLVYTGGLPRA